jgi:hypothetical protein
MVKDSAEESWLRTEGVARYDAYRRDLSVARPAADVFARLRARHAKHTPDFMPGEETPEDEV